MAFVFEDEEQPSGQFVFEDEATQAPQPRVVAESDVSTLPKTWDVDIGGQQVRGVFDPGANAYLVSDRMGQAFYINKKPDGSLGLKPYTGKASAAGTGTENFFAGAGKAAVDTARGIGQLGALAGNTLGLVSDETVDQSFADAKATNARDADLMGTGAGMVGNVAGNIASLAVGGGLVGGAGRSMSALGKSAAMAPRVASALTKAGDATATAGRALIAPKSYGQAARSGAAVGAVSSPAESLGDKAAQVGIGAAGGLAGQGIAKGVDRLAKGASDVISDETKRLANVARDKWGIAIRADQVVNSKPLNALSTAIDYVPGSGAAVSKGNIQKQFNTALAKSIGQSSDNPAFAIREAEKVLGSEFDRVLQSTPVKADAAFTDELASVMQNAQNEMTDQQFGVMRRQVDNILGKVQAGDVIDAQAAYNIKKGLDRIGKSNDSTLANYATDLKRALMDALNRSLGPDEAAKFANTRSQYSNLIALRKIVPRGAEADISPARLANLKGYMTDDLNELADIAATFLKPREGNSGTAPRLAGLAVLGGGVPAAVLNPATAIPLAAGTAATIGASRMANRALSSPAAARYAMEGSRNVARVQPIADAAPAALPAFLASYLQSQK